MMSIKQYEVTLSSLEEAKPNADRSEDVQQRMKPGKQELLNGKYIKCKLPRLTEESFEEWKLEVKTMMASLLYCPDALLHGVRSSISNSSRNMRRVLQTIGTKATTREIMAKLENIYGDRNPGEFHLVEFHRAK
ncbi:hypothetical protein DPMN_007901 [Dreissena polymorpha]|uniref:Uncharacterized protein n=1 Tax=Dreissena polymorpha TaxID=45954 RepID=A0A9D4MXT6_DREPO|nr:hypothetical protein DPMN_007901 [Dreissena polymorpha]